MSYWYERKKEDIDMSVAKDEIHIYLESDKNGAIYCSVKTKDVIEVLKENKIIK